MSQIIADLFVSADGFAGGQNAGPYFGYAGPELEAWIKGELACPQIILLGRRTYELFAQMRAQAGNDESRGLAAHPKVVVSRTLPEPVPDANVRVVRDVPGELAALKSRSAEPMRVMGSLTLVRSLLEHGLLDRLRLLVFPLTLGADGREHFWSGVRRGALGSVAAEVFDGRLALLTYTLGSDAAPANEC